MPKIALMGLVAFLVWGCGGDDDDAKGSAECKQVREVCGASSPCACPDAQETTGLQDKKGPCELLLEQWEKGNCYSCQYSELHSSCLGIPP
jgi:hypothetical protein